MIASREDTMNGAFSSSPEAAGSFGYLCPTTLNDQQPAPKRQRLDGSHANLDHFQLRANAFHAFHHIAGLPYMPPGYVHHGYTIHNTQPLSNLHQYGSIPQNTEAFNSQMFDQWANEFVNSNVSNDLGKQDPDVQILCEEDNLSTVAPSETENPVVCYGMIPIIEGKCDARVSITHAFPVKIDSADRFSGSDPEARGIISSEHGQMVQGLLEEDTLQLYVSCTLDTDSAPKRPMFGAQVPCALEITVYGPWELFESIGLWFQEYDVYLQDPRTCYLDAKYCNPHKLALDDLETCPLVSEVTSRKAGLAHMQDITARPDLLDLLSGQNDLEEASPPSMIKASLHRHQKQALTFMYRRERGWAFENDDYDIWEMADTSQGRYFINRVSDAHQDDPPPQFSGGIIADPMGLGKTLTMIALAASDLDQMGNQPEVWDAMDDKPAVQATLIVVPQPLLGTWEDQISDHVEKNAIKICRHHGKTRLTKVADIDAMNVVLTTYHTLSADWKAWKNNGDHVVFSVRWRRIILDEAHIIRNLKARMARAICDLDAVSRWAVTGTPIQNSLNDVSALLKFIRAFPYDEPKRFERDISRLWKSGEDEEAVKRLKRVAKCLFLRRAKHTIDLPPRHDRKCAVDFSKAEKALYDSIRQQTISKIDDALQNESEFSTSGVYVNFLQQIETMRLVCNLGLHYQSRHDKKSSQDASDWSTLAQEMFNIQRGMEPMVCSQCSTSLDLTETYLEDTAIEPPLFSRCLKYACPNCSRRLRVAGQKMVCGHTPRCPIAPVSISDSAIEETPGLVGSPRESSSMEMPSKVTALIADLQMQRPDVKSIVFSTWRLTLDVVETGLTQNGIQCVRFDGKVPPTQRQSVLRQFKTDPNVQVMLLTMSCGAVGLTLTEASRAYLIEPHWNPTIEEQALARIHRIGQEREVTTVRFYIRDSFEERVMEVQESKKNLAGVLLSGHDGGQADDSLGALQRLRALL